MWVVSLLALALTGCGSGEAARTSRGRSGKAVERRTPAGEFAAVADALERGENPYLGTAQPARLKGELADAALPVERRLELLYELVFHLLRHGETAEATERAEEAIRLAGSRPGLPGEALSRLERRRALAWLRHSEVRNCVRRHNRECCILPLRGGGVHEERAPAARARESLLRLLAREPDDLGARWLLNVMAMALGEHPAGVPERWLIPPAAFESSYDIGRFEDVAPALGVDTFNLCGGTVVDDVDGDGRLDIVTSTYDPRGPLRYYANLGGDRFEDRSAASGLEEQLGGLNLVGADHDGDGDVDLLVLRGAWLFDDGRIRNSLLRNDGSGRFTDVTHEAGLAEPAYPTQAAAWLDYDGDGDLDLYVGNESRLELGDAAGSFPSQLYRNDGDGTFTDVAALAGVTNDRYCKGVAVGDYDDDGDPDLYVSNIGPNRLYRNEGDGTFTDVAPELGVTGPEGRSFATWFFDYDNDGRLDLFVAAYEARPADIAADYLGLPHAAVSPRLYRNLGQGRFEDVAGQVGLAHPYLPMGANFGDLDNDGFLDVYLATGEPAFETLVPNIMLRNDRGRRFQDVTTSGGFGHLQKGHGVAFADLDEDGDQDIYHQLGGFYPGDRFHNALFRNPGHGNRFVVVHPVGVVTNRAAYGAKLRVRVATPAGPRTIHRAVGSVSSFGGSPLRQEIGLGDATRIERIEIDWPGTRATQVIEGVPLDSRVRITEGRAGFEHRGAQPVGR